MFTKSKMQRKAAMLALSVKRGEQSKTVLKGASQDMFDSMSLDELTVMAMAGRSSILRKYSAKQKTPGREFFVEQDTLFIRASF